MIKHSKYKNTGILFELLIRQISSDMLAGTNSSKAVEIVETYFGKGRELGKELLLYRALFNSKKLSESKALDFVSTLIEQRKTLDTQKLRQEKYDLVSEIKNNYPLDKFLSGRIPSYKIYASIYKNFECHSQGKVFENVEELSESKYTLVEYLCGNISNKKQLIESEILNVLKEQEEDIRLLTVKLVFEKFNKKYEDLNDKQKVLLREFLSTGTNSKDLLKFLQTEAKILSNAISNKIPNVGNDVQKIKLTEVVKQLNELTSIKKVGNHHLTALIIGYEIETQLQNFQSND